MVIREVVATMPNIVQQYDVYDEENQSVIGGILYDENGSANILHDGALQSFEVLENENFFEAVKRYLTSPVETDSMPYEEFIEIISNFGDIDDINQLNSETLEAIITEAINETNND